MKIKKIAQLSALVLVVGLGIAYAVHRNTKPVASGKISVVASFYPLYDFAQAVGGSHITVTNVTPAGAEPHDYEPAPRDLVIAQQAKVFIYDGGTLEPWVDKFLGDYRNVPVRASDHISLHTATIEGQSGVKDPHFWLDPALAQTIVKNIERGLIQADPNHRSDYTTNANAYIAQLQQLDHDFKTGLSNCQQRQIISSHEAFGYLAERYNFSVTAIAGISPDEEPSAGKLAEIADLAKREHIKYIFFESLVSPRLADTIAQESGAKTLVFDPLEGLTQDAQKQGKNYVSVQRENLANLRIALACN
jgi:zinc transport system substrate-binding protein